MSNLEKRKLFISALKSAKTNKVSLTNRVYNIENSLTAKIHNGSVSERIEKIVEREFEKIKSFQR